ncbi:MAG: ABC transporter permease subunit [Bacteroidales bacterium]
MVKERLSKARKRIMRHWQLYVILLIPVLLVAVFSYGPMYGLQIAFKDYIPSYGIDGSKWVGFKHFINFVNSHQFSRLIGNTITISLYSLIAGFPIPIILALALNECTSSKFKKTVQMVTYAPHFISTVVMVGIILLMLSPSSGIINQFIQLFGGQPIDFMAKPEWFKSIYVWSGVWQGMGYSSIIYIAALAGIDQTLHEAAIVDGASRWQRIWHVNIPGILPTVTILLIMNFGSVMSVGYEKILLMQNSLNMPKSDVISTFVYRMGLESAQYSFSAAVGLFNAVINFILLVIVNKVAKKLGETSLW